MNDNELKWLLFTNEWKNKYRSKLTTKEEQRFPRILEAKNGSFILLQYRRIFGLLLPSSLVSISTEDFYFFFIARTSTDSEIRKEIVQVLGKSRF